MVEVCVGVRAPRSSKPDDSVGTGICDADALGLVMRDADQYRSAPVSGGRGVLGKRKNTRS